MANKRTPPSEDPDLIYWQAIVDDNGQREWGCTQLYIRYGAEIKQRFENRNLSEQEVEDLVQDVFVNMIKGAKTFTSDRKFKQWLFAIAFNTIVDHLRKSSREQDADGNDENVQGILEQFGYKLPQEPYDPTDDLVNCVWEALEAFDLVYPERALVIQAAVLEGMSYKEVAQMIGREPGATGQYISESRKKFKPFLKRCQIFLTGDKK